MGFTYARIELVNADDQALVRRKLLPESKVRKATVKALVDSGASSIAINERIQKKLGLPLFRTSLAELADGSKIPVKVVGPVCVRAVELVPASNAPAVMDSEDPIGFWLGDKVTDADVVNIWKLTTVGEFSPVTVETVALYALTSPPRP